jgi:deoxyadenosine/deoxycytidine kinase
MTKLIILRGPSGVGKSTAAKALLKRSTSPTVLVELDHYRFSFVNPPHHDHDLEYEMSGSDVLIYLDASLNETLKRHETKSNPRISTDKMKEVYHYASPTQRSL